MGRTWIPAVPETTVVCALHGLQAGVQASELSRDSKKAPKLASAQTLGMRAGYVELVV